MALCACNECFGLATSFEFSCLLLLKELLTLLLLLVLLLFELLVELSGSGQLLKRLVRVLVVGHGDVRVWLGQLHEKVQSRQQTWACNHSASKAATAMAATRSVRRRKRMCTCWRRRQGTVGRIAEEMRCY